jgi:hypothetical protein
LGRLHYEPDRAILDLTLNDLVRDGRFHIQVRGQGKSGTKHRRA